MKIHIVQKGDTLWKIAKKYGVNFEELKKLNSQLSNPDMIMPGMKIKVPTSGGMVKKEAPVGHNQVPIKKEMPIAGHPFAKEKPIPIVEAPIKEAPIIKEAPKAPYTPKMPIMPEIDINNYYMMNMANMTVKEAPQPQPQLPPKPINVLPEVKEVPVPACPPFPVEQPVCEPECVPMTPVMPGSGFCLPFDPVMPYPQFAGAMPIPQGPSPGIAMPMTTGMPPAAYVPPHFEDESSSSMPQMPVMNPGYVPGGQQGMGAAVPSPYVPPGMAQEPAYYPAGAYQSNPVPGGYYPPAAYPQAPMGYPAGRIPEAPMGYPAGGYPEGPMSYPAGSYPEAPMSYPAGGYPGYPGGYPAGYPASYGAPSPGYPAPSPGYPQGQYPGERDGFNEYQNGYYQGNPAPEYSDPRAGYTNPAYGPSGALMPYGQIPYGQMPYGYPPQGTVPPNELNGYESTIPGSGAAQIPAGTGGLGDCGCGTPAPQQIFVPATPPVYMAPYTAPSNIAQPPFMNPYGMGPMGAVPYGMQRDEDESDENGS